LYVVANTMIVADSDAGLLNSNGLDPEKNLSALLLAKRSIYG